METLKSLRAKAKELREKCMTKSLTKASADEIKKEIAFFERAEKAEAIRVQRVANLAKTRESKMVPSEVPEKKKSEPKLVKREKSTIVAPVQKVRKMKKETASSDE
jgi:hypothetical protein